MSNSEVFYTELYKYIQKIAAQTVDYMVGTPIVSGIVSQSLGSYYKVQLSGGDADATVKAVTINNAHFVIDDAVYLIKAGNSVDNAYYIIGKTQAIEEDFFNLSLDERFNETSTLEVKLGADLKAEDVEALKANGGFQISANFTCNSTTENNYGLKIEFKKDDAIVNTYYLDTHYFRGQPFKMMGLTQMRTIQLESDMLESGFNNVSIKFFNEDNISATCENVKLAIGYLLNVDGIINVGIAAKNKKNYFNKKQTDVDNNVRLEAEITYNNEKFAAFGIQYYWFVKKDKCVGGKSYLSLAGAGWACLNNFEEVDTVAAPTEKIRLWDNKNNFITLDTTKKLSIIDEKGEKEIEAFSEYKNIVKCIIKYQSTIVESDEFVVYNYAKEKFGALISSNVQPLYLLTSSDEIELTCSIMDENPKTDLSKYEFSYQWYLDSECAEEEIEGANGKTLIVAVGQRGQKDKYDKDDKKYYQSSATKTYYCKVTISLNGNTVSDGEKASVTVQSKIAEGIQIGEEIRYKYYISANQYVTFKKDIESKEEEGLDWNGDWVIIDDSTQHEKIWISETGNSVVGITPVVKYGVFIGSSRPQPYDSESLTMPDKQQFNRIKAYGTEKEGSYYYWNGRWNSGGNTYDRWLAHKNKNNFDYILTNLKTKEGALVIDNVKPIIDFDVLLQMELANSENLYYTSQRVLYEMVGALRNDLRVDNWVMPTLLRSRSENGQELSENTINKMSSYSQLTNGGEKQGVYQQDVYYKLSDEEINQGPQSGKVYCTLDAETGKYTQVDVSEGFELHTDYYEFCPAKLFINAEYIQTGTLKVANSDGTNQKFFASIDETQVEIGGFNVGDTTLVGKDGDVGIGSQASGGNAFWAGPIVLPTAAPKIVYTELDFDTTGADSQADAAQNDFHSIVYQDGEYYWYLRGETNPDKMAEDGHDLGQYFKLVGYEFFKGEQLCKWEAICNLKYTSGSPWAVKYILTENIFDSNSYPFYVTHEGELFAAKVNIQGNITATGGKIGGCTIGTDGSIISSNENFKVDESGNLAATNATIAGTITADGGKINGTLYFGDSENYYLSSNKNNTLWYINLPQFRVDQHQAIFEGKLRAPSGNIGGFSISNSSLTGTQVSMTSNNGGDNINDYAFRAGNYYCPIGLQDSTRLPQVQLVFSRPDIDDFTPSACSANAINQFDKYNKIEYDNGSVYFKGSDTEQYLVWDSRITYEEKNYDKWKAVDLTSNGWWVDYVLTTADVFIYKNDKTRVPFYVTHGGFLEATNAKIGGDIYANYLVASAGGVIGGWNISSNSLSSKNSTITLSSDATAKGYFIYTNTTGEVPTDDGGTATTGYSFGITKDGIMKAVGDNIQINNWYFWTGNNKTVFNPASKASDTGSGYPYLAVNKFPSDEGRDQENPSILVLRSPFSNVPNDKYQSTNNQVYLCSGGMYFANTCQDTESDEEKPAVLSFKWWEVGMALYKSLRILSGSTVVTPLTATQWTYKRIFTDNRQNTYKIIVSCGTQLTGAATVSTGSYHSSSGHYYVGCVGDSTLSGKEITLNWIAIPLGENYGLTAPVSDLASEQNW